MRRGGHQGVPNISIANAAPWVLHSIPEAHRRGQEQAAGWGGDTEASKQHKSLRHSQGRLQEHGFSGAGTW